MRIQFCCVMMAGFFLVSVWFNSAHAQSTPRSAPQRNVTATSPCKPITPNVTTGGVMITIDYLQLKNCLATNQKFPTRVETRITEDSAVDLKVINFNFIDYTIDYKVDETVVETYVTLEKLWSQLLGLPALLPGGLAAASTTTTVCTSFEECIANWAYLIAKTNRFVDQAAHFKDDTAIDVTAGSAALTAITNSQATLDGWRLAVNDAMNKTLNETPQKVTEVDTFEVVRTRHNQLITRIDAYDALAKLTKTGQIHHIGKKKAGTIVSVTLTPKDQSHSQGAPIATSSYFVHSRVPVTFHVGYAYSHLKDIKFEKVRALATDDLYAKVKDNNSTNAFTAYLSFGRTVYAGQLGYYATIGTDFDKPGNRLYLGASIQALRRVFVTFGGASTVNQTSNDSNKLVEQVGNALKARELFTTVGSARNWGPFIGISFGVF